MYTKEEREGILWEFHRSGMGVKEACCFISAVYLGLVVNLLIGTSPVSLYSFHQLRKHALVGYPNSAMVSA